MKTSILILTYNNLELSQKCLKSVLKHTEEPFEVVVIDNASADGTPEYLRSLHDPHVRVVLNKTNVGFAKGNNQAAKLASGEILVFLNNDTEVSKGWLQPLKRSLLRKEIGIASAKLLYPNGKIQHAGIAISSDHIPRHIYRLFDADFPAANKEREYIAVTGACLAINKQTFEQVAGFDEGYLNGLEDIDLCFKVAKLGLRMLYCPASTVVHHESVSKDRFTHYFRNRERYFIKWPDIKVDEDEFYRTDGFGPWFCFRQHLNNRYLTGSYKAKAITVLKKIAGREQ